MSRAARYRDAEQAMGNNRVLSCIFNFLQTSSGLIQVLASLSTFSALIISPLLSRVHWMLRGGKWMLYWQLE